MTEMRLTDAQLATALRGHVPSAAPAGLRDRILADAEATRQLRPVPGPLAWLADADPVARRRAMLLVAAALLALGALGAAIAGAWLEQRRETIPDLNLAPPADLPAFVRSAYEKMPQLEPVTISFVDGSRTGRIHVDASGAVRTEWFASPDHAEPVSYTILSGTRKGELVVIDGRQVWSEQADAIMEDPRVFVYAALGAGRSGAVAPGCETAISPGETYTASPARGWRYVGLEHVADRPAHHVTCGDEELWIDAETSLTLRSRGPVLDEGGEPIPGRFRTVEATQVVFGQPPAQLFEMRPPAGVAVVPPEDLQCAQDSYCSASPRPIPTPMPAPSDLPPAPSVDAVVAAAHAAVEAPPAYEVVVEHWNSKRPGSTTHVLHDGAGRYRVETMFDGQWEDDPWVTLSGPDYRYATESTTDGFIFWRDLSTQIRYGPDSFYPLQLPAECADGWQLIGVDLVGGRPADHVACPGALAPEEYWIDRETHFVVRHRAMYEEQAGTDVAEVVELRFGPLPGDLFELPPGADLRE